MKKAVLLLHIVANFFSNVLADNMPFRYPANPAYYNMNNYWRDH